MTSNKFMTSFKSKVPNHRITQPPPTTSYDHALSLHISISSIAYFHLLRTIIVAKQYKTAGSGLDVTDDDVLWVDLTLDTRLAGGPLLTQCFRDAWAEHKSECQVFEALKLEFSLIRYKRWASKTALLNNKLNADEELEGENDVTEVPDTVFEKESPRSKGGEDSVGQSDKQSEDPFNIYPLLNKNTRDNNKGSSTNDSLKYPPGFTPGEDGEAEFEKSNKGNSADRENGLNNNCLMKGGTESGVSSHFKKVVPPRTGGSIILLMDELIKVGQTMSASVDNSGGILCVWDSNSFMKINATISDYFVMVR
ncbi:hypothetical protein Tco_0963768, partial [Tanacetum coccineum]